MMNIHKNNAINNEEVRSDEGEYVTKGFLREFMTDFKNDLLEILEIKFKTIDDRFDVIDTRFKAVNERFDGVDARLDGMEKKIDESHNRIDRLISQNAMEYHKVDVRLASLGA
jgi:hypothetical protein